MKKSLFTLLVLMLFGSAYAQTYTSYYEQYWNHGLHGNNATFMGQVYIDDRPSDNIALELGAYDVQDPENIHVVGGKLGVWESNGVQYEHPTYFLLVNGEAGDKIIFKLYDHENEREMNELVCADEYTFVVDGGDVTGTYVWHFYSQKEMVFVGGTQNNNWSNVDNWRAVNEETEELEEIGRLPLSFENVTIAAPCTLDMNAEVASITVESSLTIGSGDEEAYTLVGALTIKNGGQFFAPADSQYSGTIEKNIMGYNSSRDNYYLLYMPTTDFNNVTGFEAANMLNGEYDLYYFWTAADNNGPVQEEDADTWWCGEWRNYKFYMNEESGYTPDQFGTVNNGILQYSYLYANAEDITLSFEGSFYTAANKKFTPSIDGTADWGTYAIVGNPYPSNALATRGTKISGWYVMNENNNRKDVIALADQSIIVAPATSVFAVMTTGNPPTQRYVQFAPATEGEAQVRSIEGLINIELFNDNTLEDRAYVKAGEGDNMPKFSLRNDGSKIFIPQNGKKYAATYAGEAKTMPICFTSTEGGIHTISVKVENMDCSYMHLIDNVTGADIDLLRTPKYSFNADDSHYATRFKLVFDEQATNEIVESFAFISNGELMINNSGEATLQIMDITGRILSTENIQNCYSKNLNLSAGVYVVRLTNGNDVKAQKIVVE